jgi:hypothetical protein
MIDFLFFKRSSVSVSSAPTVTVTVHDVYPQGEIDLFCACRTFQCQDQVKMDRRARQVSDHVSKCFNGGAGEVDHGLLGSSASATALSRERQRHANNISRRC